MVELPPRLSAGQQLPASWLNKLRDAVRAMTLRAGPGLRLQQTPTGSTIAIAGGPGEIDPCHAGVVRSFDASGNRRVYTVRIDTGQVVRLSLTETNPTSALPVGSVVLVHRIRVRIENLS